MTWGSTTYGTITINRLVAEVKDSLNHVFVKRMTWGMSLETVVSINRSTDNKMKNVNYIFCVFILQTKIKEEN